MILYHGNKVIVESPEIRIQRYNKDFYFGFYCTLYSEQAIRWAIRFDGNGYLSFHTARALTTLAFVKGVEVHDEK